MTEYQLAKLVQTAGTIRTRKRLQKMVYLLQVAGCPLHADFVLHLFGPYSHEVARLADVLVAEGVLQEVEQENVTGRQFTYTLTPSGAETLGEFEKREVALRTESGLGIYKELVEKLTQTDLKELELASTMALFKEESPSWEDAMRQTSEFKKVNLDEPVLAQARALAESLAAS